jgi:hypothetical protein
MNARASDARATGADHAPVCVGKQRLTNVQHLLLDLVSRLDENHTRYPFKLDYA